MFDNIGKKIRILAIVITTAGILISVLTGFLLPLFIPGAIGYLIAVIVMAVGSLLAWLSSFMLYGVSEILAQTEKIYKKAEAIYDNVAYTDRIWKCPTCGRKNFDYVYSCSCGTRKPDENKSKI